MRRALFFAVFTAMLVGGTCFAQVPVRQSWSPLRCAPPPRPPFRRTLHRTIFRMFSIRGSKPIRG